MGGAVKQGAKRLLASSFYSARWGVRLHALAMHISAWRFRVGVMPRSFLDSTVKVIGWKRVLVGRNVVISSGTWLNVNHRAEAGIALTLGDNTFVGRNNFFSVGRSIFIGEYCLTTSDCAFLGSSHLATDPLSPYASAGTTSDAVIHVGPNCFFGHGARVLGHVRIGHGSIIGAGSMVMDDVPAFSMVVGNPARIIRQFDFELMKWVPARIGESLVPSEEAYLAGLRARVPVLILPVSAATSRFGDV